MSRRSVAPTAKRGECEHGIGIAPGSPAHYPVVFLVFVDTIAPLPRIAGEIVKPIRGRREHTYGTSAWVRIDSQVLVKVSCVYGRRPDSAPGKLLLDFPPLLRLTFDSLELGKLSRVFFVSNSHRGTPLVILR